MNLLVCGGRDFDDVGLLESTLDSLEDVTTLIHGCADGADSLAAKYFNEGLKGTKVIGVPADWDKHGKKAGFLRNAEMISREPDLVIAFWDGQSKGTKSTIALAKKDKITTLIIYY